MTNSCVKGKVGEREFANYLTDHGFDAERGQQHTGGADAPDVRCTALADVHFEVKRKEAGNPYLWIEQCIKDAAPGKLHVVAHRRNKRNWIAILPMEDLMRLLILRDLWYGSNGSAMSSPVQTNAKGPCRRRAVRQEPKG